MQFQVRDRRKVGWFRVDNEILDDFGAKLGPYGLAVYMALCRFADNETQDCWPSRPTIAERTGMSVKQVSRQTAKLASLGLIAIERHKDNRVTYYLLDMSYPQLGTHSPYPSGLGVPSLETVSPLKKTQRKKTSSEEDRTRQYIDGPYKDYIQY